MALSKFRSKIDRVVQKTAARAFHRRVVPLRLDAPIVSFTFDDFPCSALFTGGEILKAHGGCGTYYAALGLMGRKEPTGTIFSPDDLAVLVEQGHELGCHTFDHCHSWKTEPREFEASILRNRNALQELHPGATFESFSYPISDPRPAVKDIAGRHFASCRGGGQTGQAGTVDLNYLKSYFLDRDRCSLGEVKRQIDAMHKARGWLIFSTHDVSMHPTRYGCTPAFFEQVVRYCKSSETPIRTVGQVCRSLMSRADSMR